MRILVVNVNTTTSITAAMAATARAVVSAGTEVVGVTPTFGPASVEGSAESYLSAVGVMDAVLAYDGPPYDAVVQAGFGEHGREGLQELLGVPVVDITDAAAHTACLLGHRFGVVTTLRRTVPQILDRLRLTGLDGRCTGVRASGVAVLELEADPGAAVAAVVEQARGLVADGAEVLVLGCGGMAGLDTAVRDALGVPVVDGVAAGATLAEALVRQGLTTSKVGAYATPRSKPVAGWPLPRPVVAEGPRAGA